MPNTALTLKSVEKKVNQTLVRLERSDLTTLAMDAGRFYRVRRQVPPSDGFIAEPIDPEETFGLIQKLLGMTIS